VLVGYGTGAGATSRRKRPAERAEPCGLRRRRREAAGAQARARPGRHPRRGRPDGPAGEVTRDDVVRHAEQASVFRNIATPAAPAEREQTIPVSAAPVPAPPVGEREEAIPVKGVRKATASGMVRSAYTAPHVSVWTDVDATRTMELVKRLKASPDFADIKVSPLLIMARAVIWAVRRTPLIGAAWIDKEDGSAEIRAQLRQPRHRRRDAAGPARAEHQGRAGPEPARARQGAREADADGARGKDHARRPAGRHDHDHEHRRLRDGCRHPDHQPRRVGHRRDGHDPAEAVGRRRRGAPRFVTTVSGSFDHRVIDGDGMSRFIADVASILEEPALLLD
jgi:pyruvate dehydrogenase E2 component (dihydrolipoamide acetyltransferase)